MANQSKNYTTTNPILLKIKVTSNQIDENDDYQALSLSRSTILWKFQFKNRIQKYGYFFFCRKQTMRSRGRCICWQ